MTDRRDPMTPESIDTGEPIEILRAVSVAPRAGFMTRIAGSIRRRTLGSQLADFSWMAVSAVIVEYLSLVFELLAPSGRTERGSE